MREERVVRAKAAAADKSEQGKCGWAPNRPEFLKIPRRWCCETCLDQGGLWCFGGLAGNLDKDA